MLLTWAADRLYPASARPCVTVRETLGVEEIFPRLQTYCGQPWLNTGRIERAKRLAFHCLDLFEDAENLVAIRSSCADTVRNHYAELFPDSPPRLKNSLPLCCKAQSFGNAEPSRMR